MYAESLAAPNAEPHIFSATELKECSEGTCCNCGRCCRVFEIHRTTNPVDGHVRGFNKRMGEACPHLTRSPDGRSLCGVHSCKAHDPSLEICRLWTGREGNYRDLLDEIRTWIQQPRHTSDVASIRHWMAQGLLSDVDEFFRGPVDIIVCISQYVGELGIVPDDIFEFVGLREAIAALSPEYFYSVIMPRAGLDPALPLHASFLERYAPEETASAANTPAKTM